MTTYYTLDDSFKLTSVEHNGGCITTECGQSLEKEFFEKSCINSEKNPDGVWFKSVPELKKFLTNILKNLQNG